MKQRDWQAILQRIAVVLGALLVLLVSIALLSIFFQILRRFGDILTLFILAPLAASTAALALDYRQVVRSSTVPSLRAVNRSNWCC